MRLGFNLRIRLGSLGLACAAALVALAMAPAAADTVRLKSGQVIQGRVVDRGSYILVEKEFTPTPPSATAAQGTTPTAAPAPAPSAARPKVTIRFERAEVESIELDDGAARTPERELDVVVFVNGDELPGRVEIRNEGREVVIVGEGKRGEVTLDAKLVRTVIWSKAKAGEIASPEAKVGVTIQRLLEQTLIDGPTRTAALERLHTVGVYVMPYLEGRANDPDPGIRRTVREVQEAARIRAFMTPPLAERTPGLPRVLASGDEAAQLAALRDAIVASAKDCAPILVHLIRSGAPKDVRAFCFGQLSLQDRTEELLSLLDSKDGGTRFAAAIALGDNGLYAGIPLLLEGLKSAEPAIRKVSIQKLELWTGQFLGYFADGEPEKRQAAIEKWEAWWEKDGKALLERSIRGTVKRGEVTADEKTEGLAHWTNAQLVWDAAERAGLEGEERQKEMRKVRALLDRSLERYPHNPTARIALGVLLYVELGEPEAAKRELDLVLHRYQAEGEKPAFVAAHVHLGRIAQIERRYGEAEKHFQLALTLKDDELEAVRGLASLAFSRAIDDGGLSKEDRVRFLEESLTRYAQALGIVDKYDLELRENAESVADAVAVSRPFDRGRFLESVEAVKANLQRDAAGLHAMRGRSFAALRRDAEALRAYQAAMEVDGTNAVYKGMVDHFQKRLEEAAKEAEREAARKAADEKAAPKPPAGASASTSAAPGKP